MSIQQKLILKIIFQNIKNRREKKNYKFHYFWQIYANFQANLKY
jgi:hypothetical protein